MQLSKVLTAFTLALFAAPWCARAAVSHAEMERVLIEEITKTTGDFLTPDTQDATFHELRRMLLNTVDGQLLTNTMFGAPQVGSSPGLLPPGRLGGQLFNPTAVGLDNVDALIGNFSANYCQPFVFTPPNTRGPTFVGPKLAIKINRGKCVLAEDVNLVRQIQIDENVTPTLVTITTAGDIESELVCFGPSIRFIQTPPTVYSANYAGACLITGFCNVNFNYGLEYFRYLTDPPIGNITIPLESLRDPLAVANALGYNFNPQGGASGAGGLGAKTGLMMGTSSNGAAAAGTTGGSGASTGSATWGGWSFSMKN